VKGVQSADEDLDDELLVHDRLVQNLEIVLDDFEVLGPGKGVTDGAYGVASFFDNVVVLVVHFVVEEGANQGHDEAEEVVGGDLLVVAGALQTLQGT